MDIQEIIRILEDVKSKLEEMKGLKGLNSAIFETLVFEEVKKTIKKFNMDVTVERTGKNDFPDIIVDIHGIEVKHSESNNNWKSPGNSIFEGTFRKEVVGKIYLFFGRNSNGGVEIKHRTYEDCLETIKVTHSPRYMIDMELQEGASLLHRHDPVSYEEFRIKTSKEKTEILKEKIRKELSGGEFLWWLESEKNELASPKITIYSTLAPNIKKQYRTEGFVLFPEVLSNSSRKYVGFSSYLMQEYQTICSSLRDVFSSSGTENIMVNGDPFRVPRIIYELYKESKNIDELLKKTPAETLSLYWKDGLVTKNNKIEKWQTMIDEHALKLKNMPSSITASDVFRTGLQSDR